MLEEKRETFLKHFFEEDLVSFSMFGFFKNQLMTTLISIINYHVHLLPSAQYDKRSFLHVIPSLHVKEITIIENSGEFCT
jgi:hypothetical protein